MPFYFKGYACCVFAALTCASAQMSQAELLVELSSSPADLSQLSIGETVTIDVALSGLAGGDELELLAATVTYQGDVLGASVITPGHILPDPLDDPLDFLTVEDVGIADAIFLTFGTEPSDRIGQNGVFFSFMVTPQDLGAGTLELSFVDALQYNPADPFDPIVPSISAGAPLNYQVVPEPSGMILGVVALAVLSLMCKGRKKTD